MKKNTTAKYLFEYKDKKYFSDDIANALHSVGIQKDDKLFVHADLKVFGKINSNVTKEEYIDAFIYSLIDSVGHKGTIIMPTFSYSFCKGQIFDPQTTPSAAGILVHIQDLCLTPHKMQLPYLLMTQQKSSQITIQ